MSEISSNNSLTEPKCVIVCQHRRCVNLGARKVFNALLDNPIPNVTVVSSGCLKQCGNGPMVRVMPEQVWYHQVQPDQVPTMVEQHLIGGSPVADMLYPRFHTQKS